jgi:uncharacterized protein (TIGR03437 family)
MYAGSLPGFPFGVFGVEVELPRSLPSGNVAVQIGAAGGALSPPLLLPIG